MIRRIFSVTMVATLLLAAGVVSRAVALDADRAAVIDELRTLVQSEQSAQMRTDRLTGLIEITEGEIADRAAVLDVRGAFVTELAGLQTALTSAEGKVDTAAHRAAVQSAQQAVLAERKDPAVVVAATATVHALIDKVGQDVSVWEAAQYAAPGGPAWSSSGPDGYARVRAALDTVGGAGVGLYESASCAGGSAAACANSNGYIKYRADIAQWSSERLNWAMAHELAHIYQFRVWGALTSSDTYRSMFGGDPEFLANCMAVVRGYPGSVGCDSDQQAWASGIWVGAVR
ncbi:hypothetical protein DXT68_03355 [Microbacterium foliorum]|uniref:Uncharacterized protein n=1 Tax=Microbacterium foliorum TaxID=104336 RepID=A0A0F0KEA3_9MICO|nr:hypothetical protein [Microbacterium foliorum]AXL11273.1 hypothetical protein DXT68_03355 [Microbacterium foliorum]KJL19178.1 hypothetical protein RN50_02458 [Microbacterium foliorum]